MTFLTLNESRSRAGKISFAVVSGEISLLAGDFKAGFKAGSI
jgi:hypothetical protein